MKSHIIKQILSLLLVLVGISVTPEDEMLLENYAEILEEQNSGKTIEELETLLPDPIIIVYEKKIEPNEVIKTEEESEETKEEPKKIKKDYIYSDIGLSEDLQEYTYNLCKKSEIDYELVLAIMYTESKFNPNLISSTQDHGIMQINECNHSWLRKELGITDFLDAKQNIKAGIYIITGHLTKQGDWNRALMAYNMGEGGMKKSVSRGNRSSKYSRLVLKRRQDLIDNRRFID